MVNNGLHVKVLVGHLGHLQTIRAEVVYVFESVSWEVETVHRHSKLAKTMTWLAVVPFFLFFFLDCFGAWSESESLPKSASRFRLALGVITVAFVCVVTVSDIHQFFKDLEVGFCLKSCLTGRSSHFLLYSCGFRTNALNCFWCEAIIDISIPTCSIRSNVASLSPSSSSPIQ